MGRSYHGYTGKRSNGEGIEKLVDLCERRWQATCLGTFADRDKRGKPGYPSVHKDYRAADLRFRTDAERNEACRWFSTVAADRLGIEIIIDYSYRGPLRRAFGRIWNCTNGKWRNCKQGDVSGGGQAWANFLHIEIAPGVLSEDGAKFEAAWRSLPKP